MQNQPSSEKNKRLEFSEKTKQQALILYDFKCVDCGKEGDLEFDHAVPDGLKKNNSLSNCKPRCPICHKIKSKKDKADIARAKRRSNKHNGIITRVKKKIASNPKIQSAGFSKASKATKLTKSPLPPRQLYRT